MSIKEMVANGKMVQFIRFQKGELWYKTEDGFEFPVPVADTGDGAFLPVDRAFPFMRWIRIQLENIAKAKVGDGIEQL